MKLLSEWLLENAHPEQHGGTPLTDAEKVDLFKAYAQMTEQVQNQNLVVLVGYQGSLPILSGVRIRRGAALETTTAADTTLLELSKRLIGPDNVPEDLQRAIHFVAYNGTLAEALTSAGYA